MKLKNAIKKAFSTRTITDLQELYKEINVLAKKKVKASKLEDAIDEYFSDNLITDIAINWNEDKVVYREDLFCDTSFKIGVTEQELIQKRLYLGHRFMPYVQADVPYSAVQLQDEEGNTFELKKTSLVLEELYQYISLLPPYTVNAPKGNDLKELEMAYYDLGEWMKANDFQEKDVLLIVPVDSSQHLYRIEKLSARRLSTQTIVTQHKDNQLTAAIEDILNWYDEPMPVDVCLFRAYALCDEGVLEETGSPFGPFISNHEDFSLHNMSGFSFIHYHDYEERLMEEALEENMNFGERAVGKAKDINGIFEELGNSYSESFILGKYIQQLHQNNKIDKEAVNTIIFKKNHIFFTAKQQTNFEKAIDKLAKNIEKEWANKRLSLPVLRLLTKVLELRITVVTGLRQIDAHLVKIANLDMATLSKLHNLDMMAEQILHFIVRPNQTEKEQITPDSAVQLIGQVEEMKGYFEAGLEHILSQL